MVPIRYPNPEPIARHQEQNPATRISTSNLARSMTTTPALTANVKTLTMPPSPVMYAAPAIIANTAIVAS